MQYNVSSILILMSDHDLPDFSNGMNFQIGEFACKFFNVFYFKILE